MTPQGAATTPAQRQTTCHSGNAATLIDYCVIDYRIAALCSCTAITTPWKTHMGLIVQVSATFDKLVARVILGPKPFPFETDTRVEGTPLKNILHMSREELNDADVLAPPLEST